MALAMEMVVNVYFLISGGRLGLNRLSVVEEWARKRYQDDSQASGTSDKGIRRQFPKIKQIRRSAGQECGKWREVKKSLIWTKMHLRHLSLENSLKCKDYIPGFQCSIIQLQTINKLNSQK